MALESREAFLRLRSELIGAVSPGFLREYRQFVEKLEKIAAVSPYRSDADALTAIRQLLEEV